MAVIRQWPFSCKQFLYEVEHFVENRITLRRTVAKLWCVIFVHYFWNTMYAYSLY